MTDQERIRMLTAADVIAQTKLSRSTIWRLERAGLFPRRRQLSTGRVGWVENEVDAWLASRASVGGAAVAGR